MPSEDKAPTKGADSTTNGAKGKKTRKRGKSKDQSGARVRQAFKRSGLGPNHLSQRITESLHGAFQSLCMGNKLQKQVAALSLFVGEFCSFA